MRASRSEARGARVAAAETGLRTRSLRQWLRGALLWLLFRAGLCALFDRFNRRAYRVLTYHAVRRRESDFGSGMDISEDNFAEQITLLVRRYSVVDISQAGSIESAVALTFDDGVASDYLRAAPVLERHGVRGTYFVCDDIASGRLPATWHDIALVLARRRALGEGATETEARRRALEHAQRIEHEVRSMRAPDPYWYIKRDFGETACADYETAAGGLDEARFKYMREEQLRELAWRGHTIGGHSARHRILSHLADAEDTLLEELSSSRQELSRMLGTNVLLLAYPYGLDADVGVTVERTARQAGYSHAFYNDIRAGDNNWSLPRLQLPPSGTPWELFAVTSGLLHFLKTGRLLPRLRQPATRVTGA